ncbi:hypothetical protein ACFWXH_24285 [Mesorhizobium sp. NPDC059054]|uniref:hypothetical protein n=1 Tax=Mesorhizobium sp. NPDC059054 TaxID=3346711 RepID=UPI0036BB7729
MTGESDRIARASDYVLGLMNERDRERAERDLEIDPAFRNAVMQLAERMHLFDRTTTQEAGRPWQEVVARIAELPQMPPRGQETSRTDRRIIDGPRAPAGIGLHALPGRLAIAVAAGLIVAFAFGYLVGRMGIG